MQTDQMTVRCEVASDGDQESRSADRPSPRAIEWSSEQLFGSADEVGIRHQGSLYRLRRTRLGKLILTK